MALDQTSFPRGKQEPPMPAGDSPAAACSKNNGGAAAGAGGLPAAKRKREAKAAASASGASTPVAGDAGPDFLFGGLPKKKSRQQSQADEAGERGVGGVRGKVDEATKLAQVKKEICHAMRCHSIKCDAMRGMKWIRGQAIENVVIINQHSTLLQNRNTRPRPLASAA